MLRRKVVRKLTPGDVTTILGLIEGWSGKRITWPALCELIAEAVGQNWTRQALERHLPIKQAYQHVRDGKTGSRKRSTDPAETLLRKQVDSLKQELEKLQQVLCTYEEKFVVYQRNAHAQGITPQQLEAPLPQIDRGRSDI